MTSCSALGLELLVREFLRVSWTESRNGFPVPACLTSALRIRLCPSGFRMIASGRRFLASDDHSGRRSLATGGHFRASGGH